MYANMDFSVHRHTQKPAAFLKFFIKVVRMFLFNIDWSDRSDFIKEKSIWFITLSHLKTRYRSCNPSWKCWSTWEVQLAWGGFELASLSDQTAALPNELSSQLGTVCSYYPTLEQKGCLRNQCAHIEAPWWQLIYLWKLTDSTFYSDSFFG